MDTSHRKSHSNHALLLTLLFASALMGPARARVLSAVTDGAAPQARAKKQNIKGQRRHDGSWPEAASPS